jgi:hypothetical protein
LLLCLYTVTLLRASLTTFLAGLMPALPGQHRWSSA